jgi:transposase InsO family protein
MVHQKDFIKPLSTLEATRPSSPAAHSRWPKIQDVYTSYEFGQALRASGLLASMGRVGSAFDNAMAESVFANLKSELIYPRAWPTRHELEMEVFSYLEGLYNSRRRHSWLGDLSPNDYENIHLTRNEVSA